MPDTVTTAKLAEIAAWSQEFQADLRVACGPNEARPAGWDHETAMRHLEGLAIKLAHAVPDLLNALRWRRASEELPPTTRRVVIWKCPEDCPPQIGYWNNGWWVNDQRYEWHEGDLWLPLPPGEE